MNNDQQLFDQELITEWEQEWQDMPEYNNAKQEEAKIVALFRFRNREDFEKFNLLIKEHIYNGERPFDGMQQKDKKSAWYPHDEKGSKYLYIDEIKNES